MCSVWSHTRTPPHLTHIETLITFSFFVVLAIRQNQNMTKWKSLSFILGLNTCLSYQIHLPLLPIKNCVWWGMNPASPLLSLSVLPSRFYRTPPPSLPHSFPSPHLSPLSPSPSSPESKPTMLISGSSSLWSLLSPLSLANGAFEVSFNSRAPNTHSWRRRHYLLCYLSGKNVPYQLQSHVYTHSHIHVQQRHVLYMFPAKMVKLIPCWDKPPGWRINEFHIELCYCTDEEKVIFLFWFQRCNQ